MTKGVVNSVSSLRLKHAALASPIRGRASNCRYARRNEDQNQMKPFAFVAWLATTGAYASEIDIYAMNKCVNTGDPRVDKCEPQNLFVTEDECNNNADRARKAVGPGTIIEFQCSTATVDCAYSRAYGQMAVSVVVVCSQYANPNEYRPFAHKQEAKTSPATTCDPVFLKLDALFVHATAACNGTDYMDSKIGLSAHKLASSCWSQLAKPDLDSIVRKQMLEFDGNAKQYGLKKACQYVDDILSDLKH
jgi:hypothetical protein